MSTTTTVTSTTLPRTEESDPMLYTPLVGEDPWVGIDATLAHRGPLGIVGLDVETEGVDWDDRLRTVQFGTPTHAVVLDVSDPAHAAAARTILADQSVTFTAHNSAFDVGVLHREGYTTVGEIMPRVVDTMVLAALNEPPSRFEGERGGGSAMDLKSLSATVLGDASGRDAKKALTTSWRKQGWLVGGPRETRGWAQCDVHEECFLRYAADDVIYGSRLAETLLPLVAESVGTTVIQREHRLLALCVEMQIRGYLVDTPRVSPLVTSEQAVIASLDAQLAALGVSEPTKNRVVAEALEAETGVVLPLTEKGEKQVDKLTLTKLSGSKIAPVLLARRATDKGATTYLSSWLELSRSDGRLHPTISSLRAATGRFAMDKPSLQNVPKDLRDYILAEPGCALVTSDFGSIEMRIGAGFAQDANLTQDFIAGLDVYRLVAHAVWHPSDADFANVTGDERQRAKAVLLGRMYGRSAKSVATQEGIATDEAERVMAFIDHRYPRLGAFATDLEHRVKMGLTRLRLPSGRSVAVDPTWARKAMNYLVQGTGRELMVDAGFRLTEVGLRDNLWLSVHDEWIVNVPAARAAEVADLMQRTMATTFMGVPVVAESKVLGAHWGK